MSGVMTAVRFLGARVNVKKIMAMTSTEKEDMTLAFWKGMYTCFMISIRE